MPALTNVRWELFATGVAQGKTKQQAYFDAGFSQEGSGSNSVTLMKRPEVQARVSELIEMRTQFKANYVKNGQLEHLGAIEQAAEEGNVSREWVVTMLMENAKLARDAGQYAASNSALGMLGKEIGMFQEQRSKTPDEADKQAALPAPVSVDKINGLLEGLGYKGPPIDLTNTKLPVMIGDKNAKSSRS